MQNIATVSTATLNRPAPPATLESTQNELNISQYLSFALAGETYAISIQAIKEIIQCSSITVVPKMPPRFRGVINLRGSVLPVLDLTACLKGVPAFASKRTCVVIVEINAGDEPQDVGVMVDAVHAVLDIPSSEMEPAPQFGTGIRPEFIHGMGKVKGEFIVILDIARTLMPNSTELISHKLAESEATSLRT